MKTNSKKFSIRFARGKASNLAASLREDVQKLVALGDIDARQEIIALKGEIDRMSGRVGSLEKELATTEGRLALADEACKIKDDLIEALRQNNTESKAQIQVLQLKLKRVEEAVGG